MARGEAALSRRYVTPHPLSQRRGPPGQGGEGGGEGGERILVWGQVNKLRARCLAAVRIYRVGMPRIYLRLNGSATGCVAKLPESFAELLEIANSKLLSNSEAKAARIFSASSDEILEEDFELIEHNDVLYVSTGEEWVAPPKEEAEVTSSSAALPQAAATSSAAVPAAAVPPLVDPAAVAAAVAAATSGEVDAERRWQLRLLLPLRAPSQLPQRLRKSSRRTR